MIARMKRVATGPAGLWRRLFEEESGQDLIEYALILAFLAIASVATMKGLAANLANFFGSLGTTLTGSI